MKSAHLSAKQKRSIVEATARINLWEGSVRSGKSLALLWWFAGAWLGRRLFARAPRTAIILGASRGPVLVAAALIVASISLVERPGPLSLAVWVLGALMAAAVARWTRERVREGLALVPRRRRPG